MDKLLITGASGLVGSNLAFTVRDRFDVVGLYHRHPVQIAGCRMAPCDFSQAEAAGEWVRRERPELIVHAAGPSDAAACESDPQLARQLLVDTARSLAQAARDTGACLVYLSCHAVFSGPWLFHAEDETPRPADLWGRLKLDGEQAVRETTPRHLIFRTSLYGWNLCEDRRCWAEDVVAKLQQEHPVQLFSDMYSTPMIVNDFLEVLLEAYVAGLTGTYHVAGAERTSESQFARTLAREFGLATDPIQAVPRGRTQPTTEGSLATRKISDALRRPMPLVREGIERFRQLWDGDYVGELRGALVPMGNVA